ncbi:hypothetical protein BJX61DRAFT_408975 [Aspergillus egyptiacus]|nr:hypothetical protein BJX61DRAFT_408975 [Aspergillus egyptiacus]
MSFDRVIQDSDDEGDPLLELIPERTNRVPATDDDHAKSFKAPDVNNDSHIGVDFDQFLQPQDVQQTMLSSSQQRREERWIPVAGRVGSMGTMMTEIGLAQERLFDDDQQQAQHVSHQMIIKEAELPQTLEQNGNRQITAHLEAPSAHELPITLSEHTKPHPELQVPALSDHWSQSVPSYNAFDSSSHTATGQLDRADFIRDSGSAMRTEPIHTPEIRRWASMQGATATSSPHDTEPFSSVISPKAFRAKSDNTSSNIVQPSPASVDELALPVTVEMPKVEKRGRKKKQPPAVNDQDDELSYAQPWETAPNKPEKRKPGRPPKNAKPLDDSLNAEVPGISLPTSGEMQNEIAASWTLNDERTELHGPPKVIVDNPISDIQAIPSNPGQGVQPCPRLKKEPKKKKLKRGKTTSVTLTKSLESDVEDDVIWIDERPVIPANPEEEPIPTTAKANTDNDTATEPAPAPKKRGRKRKKTAEPLDQKAEPPVTDELQAQAQEETIDPEDPNHLQLNDTYDGPDVSVVLNNTTHTNTPHTNPAQDDASIPQPTEETRQPTSALTPSKPEVQSQPPETPQKATDPQTPSRRAPGKHSPISSTCKVPYRVGLSKKARIAPLLKIIKR